MAKLPPPLESSIQSLILEYLPTDKRVAMFWRQNTGAANLPGGGGRKQFVKFGNKGVSDILGVLEGGRALAIEVKRPGSKPTDYQQIFIDAVNAAGGLAFIATSVSEVIDQLDQLDVQQG